MSGRARFFHHDSDESARAEAEAWAASEPDVVLGEIVQRSEDGYTWRDFAWWFVTECRWFHACHNPAEGTLPHPVLGDVPTCGRCAQVVGMVLQS